MIRNDVELRRAMDALERVVHAVDMRMSELKSDGWTDDQIRTNLYLMIDQAADLYSQIARYGDPI